MSDILIYTKTGCPYCASAKQLLEAKGQSYKEVDIVHHPDKRSEMVEKAGGRTTVPQIFIGSKHVGGCDDLHALDRDGKLDGLLAA